MNKNFVILLFILISNFFFSQQKECHQNCNITWEQIRNSRNPLWTKVEISEECLQKINDKRQEFIESDYSNFQYLKKVACSYAEGWVENIEGECNAGGPPPCCPVQHWHKDPNAWQIYTAINRKVYDDRHQILDKIYENCQKEENYRKEQERIRQENERIKAEEEKKRQQEIRLAEEKKLKEEQQKRQAEREAEQKRQAEAERKRIEEEKYRQHQKFEEQKKSALENQRNYDKQQAQYSSDMTSMMLLWAGFYMFDEPLNRYYNTRGLFFSIGPSNSLLFCPTYVNSVNYHYFDESIYQHGMIVNKDSKPGVTFTPTFGVNSTLGYVCDAFHINFPVNANIGFFPNSFSFNYSLGSNVFFGLRNIEHFKLGFGIESKFTDIFKSNRSTSSYSDQYSEYLDYSEAKFKLKTLKFGIRIQNNFNSLETNTEEPFVTDLFFTLNHVKELNSDNGFNKYIHPVAPGFEFNVNKYGVFGVYGKVAFIRPTGDLNVYQTNSSIEETYTTNGLTKYENESSSFTLGDKFFPYIEVGIKKEYSWFKEYSENGSAQSSTEPFSFQNFNLTMNYDYGSKNVFYGYSHKDSVKNFKFRTKDLTALDSTLKFKSISFDLQYNASEKFSAGFLFRKYFYTKEENATENHSAADYDLSLRTNFINYDKFKLYGNYIFGFNTSKVTNETSLYRYHGLNGQLALGTSYYITQNIGINCAIGYSIHNYYMSKGLYKDKDIFTNQDYTFLNIIKRKHINFGLVFKL